MSEIDPGTSKDMVHFGIEDCGIGIDQAVNAIFVNKLIPVIKRCIVQLRWASHAFQYRHDWHPSLRRQAKITRQKKSKYSFCSQSVVVSLAASMPCSLM